jgi:hypothetical protein
MLSEMVQNLFGVSHDKIDAGCRMILMEAKKNSGYKIPGQSCARRERDNARDIATQIQFTQDLFELGEHMLQALSQSGSDWSQSHASSRADEEGCFQITFQPADVAGYCRLRKMEAASGFGNLADLSHYEKSL